jgi:hypothetical protein
VEADDHSLRSLRRFTKSLDAMKTLFVLFTLCICGCQTTSTTESSSEAPDWVDSFYDKQEKYKNYIGTNELINVRFENMCSAINLLPIEIVEGNYEQYHYTIFFSNKDKFEPFVHKHINDKRDKVRIAMQYLLEDITPKPITLGYPAN